MVDSEVKEEATIILKDLGLSMSSAINLFLRQVIKRDGLPPEGALWLHFCFEKVKKV